MDKAFIKGLRVIEALADGNGPRGVTALARQLDLTKSNVHRLLTTLLSRGYVTRNPADSSYELSTRLWELSSTVIRRMNLPTLARPVMYGLSEKTHETVHLSILDGAEIVYIDKIEGAHHIRAHTSIGARAPAWAVATGKAMLAHKPEEYLDRFADCFIPFTLGSCRTLEELRCDIRKVRTEGCAILYHGEWREGIGAVAAAILNHHGEPVGAIGISGPDNRLQPDDLHRLSSDVMRAADAISRALGGMAAV